MREKLKHDATGGIVATNKQQHAASSVALTPQNSKLPVNSRLGRGPVKPCNPIWNWHHLGPPSYQSRGKQKLQLSYKWARFRPWLKFVPECPETPGHQPQTKHPLHSQACSSCSESLLCFCSKTAFASAISNHVSMHNQIKMIRPLRPLRPISKPTNLDKFGLKIVGHARSYKDSEMTWLCLSLATSFHLTPLSSSRHAPFNQNADVAYYSTFRPEARKKTWSLKIRLNVRPWLS